MTAAEDYDVSEDCLALAVALAGQSLLRFFQASYGAAVQDLGSAIGLDESTLCDGLRWLSVSDPDLPWEDEPELFRRALEAMPRPSAFGDPTGERQGGRPGQPGTGGRSFWDSELSHRDSTGCSFQHGLIEAPPAGPDRR